MDGPSFKNNLLVELDATWTDYDGDDAYSDYRVMAGYPATITPLNAYEPGLWRKIGATAEYLHNDHLGTLRATTTGGGVAGASRVFTAFGERISGTADRFGYVGAWGYQAATSDTPGDPYVTGFSFLHLGARYYDPSSGRFLQRDPIGIRGGLNVYTYALNNPSRLVDPTGLITLGIGLSCGVHLGFINFQFEISFHIGNGNNDGHSSAGFTWTLGAGTGVGLGGSAGLVGTVTTADDVRELGGGAYEGGVDAGPISVGGIYIPPVVDVPGQPNTPGNAGLQGGIGVGVGGGIRVGASRTGVVPIY